MWLVVGAFQFGHDAQHGQQEAQVGGDRRLQRDLPVGQFLDFRVQRVDDLLALGHRPERISIAVEQGIGRPGQIFGDHGEQLDDLGLDSLQLTLKFRSRLSHSLSLLSGRPVLQPCTQSSGADRSAAMTR